MRRRNPWAQVNPIDKPKTAAALRRLRAEIETLNQILEGEGELPPNEELLVKKHVDGMLQAVGAGEMSIGDARDEVAEINRALLEGSIGLMESGIAVPMPGTRQGPLRDIEERHPQAGRWQREREQAAQRRDAQAARRQLEQLREPAEGGRRTLAQIRRTADEYSRFGLRERPEFPVPADLQNQLPPHVVARLGSPTDTQRGREAAEVDIRTLGLNRADARLRGNDFDTEPDAFVQAYALELVRAVDQRVEEGVEAVGEALAGRGVVAQAAEDARRFTEHLHATEEPSFVHIRLTPAEASFVARHFDDSDINRGDVARGNVEATLAGLHLIAESSTVRQRSIAGSIIRKLRAIIAPEIGDFAAGFIKAVVRDARSRGLIRLVDDMDTADFAAYLEPSTLHRLLDECAEFMDVNSADLNTIAGTGFTYEDLGEAFYEIRARRTRRRPHRLSTAARRLHEYASSYPILNLASDGMGGLSVVRW